MLCMYTLCCKTEGGSFCCANCKKGEEEEVAILAA